MIQDHELDALLGDTAAEITPEQRDEIRRALDQIEEVHGDPAEPGMTMEIATGAMMLILGDDTMEGLAAGAHRARAASVAAMDRLRGAMMVEAARGVPESTLASRAGVHRQTVRGAVRG